MASRKYKSELTKTQKPCQLFNAAGHKISFQTPHKRDFKIFVPADELHVGQTLTWLIWDHARERTFERVLKIIEVSAHHAFFNLESEEEKVFQKRRFKKRPWNSAATNFEGENPFLPDAVFAGQRYKENPGFYPISLEVPETIEYAGKAFRRKTHFCFVFAPEKRKQQGSVWQRVMPESVEMEFFRYDFDLYDLLTGRKVEIDLITTRNRHFSETGKISPQWRAIS